MRLRSEDSIKCIEDSLKFKLYKGLYIYISIISIIFSKSCAMLKDFFLEKLENKKLLTRKIVKSKIRVTADENLV